jgi:hypothetical protein
MVCLLICDPAAGPSTTRCRRGQPLSPHIEGAKEATRGPYPALAAASTLHSPSLSHAAAALPSSLLAAAAALALGRRCSVGFPLSASPALASCRPRSSPPLRRFRGRPLPLVVSASHSCRHHAASIAAEVWVVLQGHVDPLALCPHRPRLLVLGYLETCEMVQQRQEPTPCAPDGRGPWYVIRIGRLGIWKFWSSCSAVGRSMRCEFFSSHLRSPYAM